MLVWGLLRSPAAAEMHLFPARAVLGFAALLVTESVTGKAFF